MTTGDSLYSDSGARAVLRIGRNSIRLDSGTNFQSVNLRDNVSVDLLGFAVKKMRYAQAQTAGVNTGLYNDCQIPKPKD
jgi:hypothetical protein